MKQIFSYTEAVRRELLRQIGEHAPTGGQTKPWGPDFLKRLESFVVTGKLLRGCLVCYAYQACSGEAPSQAVVTAAAALEITHSALLIHDDVIDNDQLRRGQPAIHRQYQLLAADRGLRDSQQFGTSMAICGGDAALFLAFKLLSEVQAKTQNSQLFPLFTEQLITVCAGQMQDIYLDACPKLPARSAIFQLMKAKTAAYTLALPLAMGALLANAEPAVIDSLKAFGEIVGVLFQIRDDELGLMGNATALGKPIGSDIREGKKTLMYFYLMKRASSVDRQILEQLFSNPILPPGAVTTVRKLIHRYQVQECIAEEVGRLEQQARRSLPALQLPPASAEELSELVSFCAQRIS